MARPGGNLTGLEHLGIQVAGKRLELLKEAVPTISRVAVLVDPAQAAHAEVPSNLAREAQALGVQLQRVEAGAPAAFDPAFTAMVQSGADALLIMGSPALCRASAAAPGAGAPAPAPDHGVRAALGRGGEPAGLWDRLPRVVPALGHLCAQDPHGIRPADLPVEQASFQLVVNLKTAEALGVTMPPTFLFRADEVIE